MNARPSPFADPDRGTLSSREPSGRRLGEIISFLFLALLGTVATMTSLPTGGHAQADSQVATAQSSASSR